MTNPIRIAAVIAMALTLAACGTTRPHTMSVAYVAADGSVQFEPLYNAPSNSTSGMQSISTYNPFTGRFDN